MRAWFLISRYLHTAPRILLLAAEHVNSPYGHSALKSLKSGQRVLLPKTMDPMTSNSPASPDHIHLDVLGGIAGDMFIAALLDARPDLMAPCIKTIRDAGLPESWIVEAVAATDTGMTGHRMRIEPDQKPEKSHGHDHEHDNGQGHSHHHYSDIRRTLEGSNLEGPVLDRALALVHLIAVTEAEVHGVDVENVALHEVGDLDSLADMVGAAYLIETLAADSWSVSPLPVGGGFIQAAHGRMPVPAPATQLLLEGFSFVDDGVMGERITPTGAAILKHLNPARRLPVRPLVSNGTGQGFGTRQMDGMANMVRARFYQGEPDDSTINTSDHQVAVLEFVIDDQTPEDLAIGLEKLRERDDVLEVLQVPAMAKKGRMGHIIQVIAESDARSAVAEVCFLETTTLGLRWRIEHRQVLDRNHMQTDGGIRVKSAVRPGGTTSAKAEADDIANAASGHYERQQVRQQAETEAKKKKTDG